MVMEADQQLKEAGIDRPTHVFVQAGVGSLAGAVVGYFAHKYKENPPVMVVCEASAADCLYRSAMKESGDLVNVGGDLQTIMAGLACGEANTIGWDILRNHVSVFASCPDWMSAKATRTMRIRSVMIRISFLANLVLFRLVCASLPFTMKMQKISKKL